MRDLRIGILGFIKSGEEAGRFVEVIDDAGNSGGFLIVTYKDEARSPEIFDSWVESITDVDLFFDENGWEIEWLE